MSPPANKDLIAAATRLTRLGRIESGTMLLQAGARNSPDEAILRALLEHSQRFHDREALREATYKLAVLDGQERDPFDRVTLPKPDSSIDGSAASSVALRVAGVMDEFTTASYAPECIYLPLDPSISLEQIEEFKPDFVFVESAWQGNGGIWSRMVNTASARLREMLQYCRDKGVPTIFWNKEDPVHFSTFLEAARLCDFIFTTDLDCIPAYKQALGHERVYLLPFAAQPRAHNPIATIDRKDAFNFAGSYYLRYPQRQRDFATVIDAISGLRPVEIYDRNHGKTHPHYKFPDRYKPLIIGSLPFADIEKAYKGYRYGINMNTIKQSQTMFSRRVFELLASNTVVVSNFSHGVRTFFGDMVLCSDDGDQLVARLAEMTSDDVLYRKFRLLGLRKVMQDHCYAERLRYILSKVRGTEIESHDTRVGLIAIATCSSDVDRVLGAFSTQSHTCRQLFILAPRNIHRSGHTGVHWFDDHLELIDAVLRDKTRIDMFGMIHPADHYGASYLTDLVLSRRYFETDAVGKACHYELQNGSAVLKGEDHRYRPVDRLMARASLARGFLMTADLLAEILLDPDQAAFQRESLLALDEFNYCRNAAGSVEAERITADLQLPYQGIELAQIFEAAEKLGPAPRRMRRNRQPHITVADMAAEIRGTAELSDSVAHDRFCVNSMLSAGRHAYLWMKKFRPRKKLDLVEQNLIHFEMTFTTEAASLVCEFYAADRRKLSHTMLHQGGSHVLAIPEECTDIRFGVRVVGPGSVQLGDISCGADLFGPPVVVGTSDTLVSAKQYPRCLERMTCP